mgnify:CR=1 FL=1
MLTILQIGVNMLPLKKSYNTDVFRFKEFIQEVFDVEKIDNIKNNIPIIEKSAVSIIIANFSVFFSSSVILFQFL